MHRLVTLFKRVAVGAAVLLAFAPFGAHSAGATGNDTWSVDPGGVGNPGARNSFNYTLKAGQTFQDVVSVTNTSDAPLTLNIYPADAYVDPVDGAFGLRLATEPNKDAGAWVVLPAKELTIPPSSRSDVPFNITIPPDALPGDHAGGIIAEAVTPTATTDATGATVFVKRRVATRVYVRVAGTITPQLQVTHLSVSHHSSLMPPFGGRGSATITYEVHNTGNIRIKGTSTVKVTGFFGRTIKTFAVRDLPDLLPSSSIKVTEKFTGLPPFELLSAEVSVKGEGVSGHASSDFWAISWLLVFLVIVVIVAVIVFVRRHRRGNTEQPVPVAST